MLAHVSLAPNRRRDLRLKLAACHVDVFQQAETFRAELRERGKTTPRGAEGEAPPCTGHVALACQPPNMACFFLQ